jgi:hypothetical protein
VPCVGRNNMNNTLSQWEQIENYFKEYKTCTSQQLREAFHFSDIRKSVSILKQAGKVRKIGKKGRYAIYQYQGACTPIETPKKAIIVKDQEGYEYIKYVPVNENISSGDKQIALC